MTFENIAQTSGVTYSDEELANRQQRGERDEDFKDRIDKHQQMAKERFEMADLDEKLQLSDDPMALIAKELKALRSLSAGFAATNADLQEQIDELHDKSDAQLDVRDPLSLIPRGDISIYPEGDSLVIESAYRGDHWCYVKDYDTIGDMKVCWNTGGYINVGGYATPVTAGDIASELDVTTDEYLFYDMSIVQATGVISQAYTTNATLSTAPAAQNHFWIPLIKYSYDGTIVTIHEQILTKTPEAQTLRHVADSGTSYWLGNELRVTTTEYD